MQHRVPEMDSSVWKLPDIAPILEKSAPDPGQDFPMSELYALNLGHVYARGVEICLKSEGRFSEVGIICLESEARLCTVGEICPKFEGRFSEVGIICLESEARFSEVGMVSPRSGAYK